MSTPDPIKPELQWFGDHGFYPAKPDGVYDEAYFRKYEGYASTPMGDKLNRARLSLVESFLEPGELLVDVGIGCGQFVLSRSHFRGYDVNPYGVAWLKERGLYLDPYLDRVDAITCWDSLEHLEIPRDLFRLRPRLVFVCMPIFVDRAHVIRSRHFRPDEHFWYYTDRGLRRFFESLGYRQVAWNRTESMLGREDIESYAFVNARAPHATR